MTVTVAEAQTKLAQIIARAEAGEEVFIGREPDHPAVKLVPLAPSHARLSRHPDLIGSTVTHDPAALVQPLPPEDWGDLAGKEEPHN
jgi:antitoxin (DNA-binding transcriptional repressor) of toxin-antitoxin stability system